MWMFILFCVFAYACIFFYSFFVQLLPPRLLHGGRTRLRRLGLQPVRRPKRDRIGGHRYVPPVPLLSPQVHREKRYGRGRRDDTFD